MYLLFVVPRALSTHYSCKMCSVKRSHKTLSIFDKIKIVEDINKGLSGRVLAQKYGVGTSTISDIKKKSEKFKK